MRWLAIASMFLPVVAHAGESIHKPQGRIEVWYVCPDDVANPDDAFNRPIDGCKVRFRSMPQPVMIVEVLDGQQKGGVPSVGGVVGF